MSSIESVVSEEKMFENVDGRTDYGRQTTDARVTGILIAHLGAFGSGELIKKFWPDRPLIKLVEKNYIAISVTAIQLGKKKVVLWF